MHKKLGRKSFKSLIETLCRWSHPPTGITFKNFFIHPKKEQRTETIILEKWTLTRAQNVNHII